MVTSNTFLKQFLCVNELGREVIEPNIRVLCGLRSLTIEMVVVTLENGSGSNG